MDSDNIKVPVSNSNNPLTSVEYEQLLQSEYNHKQAVTELRYPLSARSIIVPACFCYPERHIAMTDNSNYYKELLYKLIVAAYNYAFTDKSAALSANAKFSTCAHVFVDWLNSVDIKNPYSVLKDYEEYRFDVVNNHGGSSSLIIIKILFNYALVQSTELIANIKANDLAYLHSLWETRVSPNLNKSQRSLASYFGGVEWLRRDDVGIGNDLYMALASPKLTVNSLSLTASTVIVDLAKYKCELRTFFKSQGFDEIFFITLYDLSRCNKSNFLGNVLYRLLTAYHTVKIPSETLKQAFELVLLSNSCNEESFEGLKLALLSQSQCDALFLNKVRYKTKLSSGFCNKNITSALSGHLFSLEVLEQLTHNKTHFPFTAIEELMFSWLMATLTVQPSDIPKLTHQSFRLLKVGNRTKHIECEYFKGRAKVFHTTRSLSSSSPEGKALSSYLLMRYKGAPLTGNLKELTIFSGFKSLTGILSRVLSNIEIQQSLKKQHQEQGDLPMIMPRALVALIENGIHPENVISRIKMHQLEKRHKLVRKSGTACQQGLFKLQAIKNSAVHSFSDPYTFEFLINRNSHSNKVEKYNYLNCDNEEWINIAGRITREVMFDLVNNVFNLRLHEVEEGERQKVRGLFNSEFMSLTEDISYRKDEMIARLKIVTGQKKGKINEVGFLALNEKSDGQEFSPLYVIDSPITAWKMNNYLYEFKKNYKKLLSRNSDYLFKTALPTVEWIEYTLSQLSKDSQKRGRKIFENAQRNNVVVSVFHSI